MRILSRTSRVFLRFLKSFNFLKSLFHNINFITGHVILRIYELKSCLNSTFVDKSICFVTGGYIIEKNRYRLNLLDDRKNFQF